MGAKGVGEPPTISSTPAVIAAIQDAMNTAYGQLLIFGEYHYSRQT